MQHTTLFIAPFDTRFRFTLEDQLDRTAYTVRFVEDWEALRANAATHAPDLVVLDTSADEHLWRDLIGHLRADPQTASIPVLLLVAHDAALPAWDDHAPDDWVTAPWSEAELHARIHKAIQTHAPQPSSKPQRSHEQFTAEVVHELRAPLSVLTLMSDNLFELYDRLDDLKRRQLVRLLRERARHLNKLVEDLLVLARNEDSRHNAPRQRVNLALLVREELTKQDELINRKQLHIQASGIDDVPVHGNIVQLQQIVANLLNNAIKYTAAAGTIEIEYASHDATAFQQAPWPTVTALQAGDWAALRITDSGIGISTEDLQHIFERFYRANSEGDIIGTGLGLAIVRELVEAHQGYIAVSSIPGKGTTFAVYLSLLPTSPIPSPMG